MHVLPLNRKTKDEWTFNERQKDINDPKDISDAWLMTKDVWFSFKTTWSGGLGHLRKIIEDFMIYFID